MNKGITQPQMRAIYKLGSANGLDNETLHEVVYNTTGCTSIKLLSSDEAGRIITRLRDDAVYGNLSAPPLEEASDAQKRKLWAMMYELWSYDAAPPKSREERLARMAGLIKKILKRNEVNIQYPLGGISKADIAKLIKAAERYIENERRKGRCD